MLPPLITRSLLLQEQNLQKQLLVYFIAFHLAYHSIFFWHNGLPHVGKTTFPHNNANKNMKSHLLHLIINRHLLTVAAIFFEELLLSKNFLWLRRNQILHEKWVGRPPARGLLILKYWRHKEYLDPIINFYYWESWRFLTVMAIPR